MCALPSSHAISIRARQRMTSLKPEISSVAAAATTTASPTTAAPASTCFSCHTRATSPTARHSATVARSAIGSASLSRTFTCRASPARALPNDRLEPPPRVAPPPPRVAPPPERVAPMLFVCTRGQRWKWLRRKRASLSSADGGRATKPNACVYSTALESAGAASAIEPSPAHCSMNPACLSPSSPSWLENMRSFVMSITPRRGCFFCALVASSMPICSVSSANSVPSRIST